MLALQLKIPFRPRRRDPKPLQSARPGHSPNLHACIQMTDLNLSLNHSSRVSLISPLIASCSLTPVNRDPMKMLPDANESETHW